MSKRCFEIEFRCSVVIELDDSVIQAVDDDWRSSLYDLHAPEEIAEHIGYNMIVNGINLSSMDGWADMDDSLARIVLSPDWTTEALEQVRR